MKRCFKCGKVKRLDLFYPHKMMLDGYLNKCKRCTKLDVNRRYSDPAARERIREYEHQRNQTIGRKANKKMYQKIARARHPQKNRARRIIHRAIRSGLLKRRECMICGDIKSEAHHVDYRQPFNIKWLCFIHHRQEHSLIRKSA